MAGGKLRIDKDSDKIPPKKSSFSAKKHNLIEVAANLIVKKGFYATTMNEIAAELGINKASLYYYCKNKDEIALEIERLNLEYTEKVFIEADKNCENGLEKLRYFFMQYALLMTTSIGAAGTQIIIAPHSEDLEDRTKVFFRKVDRKVRDYVVEGQEDGSLGKGSIRWTDYALFGILHWIPRWYSIEKKHDPKQLAEGLFNVLTSGLLPR